jgi:hypothetical protein
MKDRLRTAWRYFATLRLCVNRFSRQDAKAQSTAKKRIAALLAISFCITAIAAQTLRRPRPTRPAPQTQAPRGSATKYSAFLHSSDKHKGLQCNACHKIPTAWTAKREFPDVADFPDHDACVRCHRPQFFTGQAMIGTGPAICAVCHVRAAPREDARFRFGLPNNSNQPAKAKDERQFTIEFPHDKHQNAIASTAASVRFVVASFARTPDDKKPDYNNCTICHQPNKTLAIAPLPTASPDPSMLYPFKSMPHSHDACFDCHWKNLKPAGDDCGGCHKASATFLAVLAPKRISAKFAHEGGKGAHVDECTTCHINITRAGTLSGLTPDVPIAACTNCHKDSKKITYPKAVSIEDEFAQNKKTGECTYCHTPDVGKKKPPPSHDAAAQ